MRLKQFMRASLVLACAGSVVPVTQLHEVFILIGSKRTLSIVTGVIGAAVASPLIGAATASADTGSTWDRVAQCESSGNWSNHDSGGNGHYGGLQFSVGSWIAAGGGKYAPRADEASKAEQIAVAQNLLRIQGPGAWQCAGAGGLTSSSGAGSGTVTSEQPSAPVHHHRHVHLVHLVHHAAHVTSAHNASGGSITVKSGDTLSQIASNNGTTFQHLAAVNGLSNPDLIFPGQVINLS